MKKLTSFIFTLAFLFVFSIPGYSADRGNTTNQSFSKAKKMLERKVYYDHRTTFYCDCPFTADRNILLVTITPRKKTIKEHTAWNGSTSYPLMPLDRVFLNGGTAIRNVSPEKENPSKDETVQGKWPFRSGTWRPTCTIWCRPSEK
jgi:hypothetical protein